jgi:hypothetical protein
LSRIESAISDTHALLAPPGASATSATHSGNPPAPAIATRAPARDIPVGSLPPVRHLAERRWDYLSADLVDVGLTFADVYGFDKGEDFFICTVVAPHVYRRVLLGPRRRRNTDSLPDNRPLRE